VCELVPEGVIAIVLGESGAGKSTLLNALLGRAVLETGAVRASDDAGRHTTVTRRMVSLDDAGVIVDEPGLRSLPLVGHERGLAKVFPDIASEAVHCRFRDCTHTHEPGCAVREHAETNGYAGRRLDAYLSLAREMRVSRQTLDPDVVI
jgi:ribosome biogenesis GTPase